MQLLVVRKCNLGTLGGLPRGRLSCFLVQTGPSGCCINDLNSRYKNHIDQKYEQKKLKFFVVLSLKRFRHRRKEQMQKCRICQHSLPRLFWKNQKQSWLLYSGLRPAIPRVFAGFYENHSEQRRLYGRHRKFLRIGKL